jgi:hypothetical protein
MKGWKANELVRVQFPEGGRRIFSTESRSASGVLTDSYVKATNFTMAKRLEREADQSHLVPRSRMEEL